MTEARAESTGWTALFFASREGHAEIVEILLRAGADFTKRDKNGKTAIEWAKNEAVARVLARAGATILRDEFTKIEQRIGAQAIESIISDNPGCLEALADAEIRHRNELTESFKKLSSVSDFSLSLGGSRERQEPWKWSAELVHKCWCNTVGLEAHSQFFEGVNGTKLLRDVTVKWMVDRGIPRAKAQAAFSEIERMKKLRR